MRPKTHCLPKVFDSRIPRLELVFSLPSSPLSYLPPPPTHTHTSLPLHSHRLLHLYSLRTEAAAAAWKTTCIVCIRGDEKPSLVRLGSMALREELDNNQRSRCAYQTASTDVATLPSAASE